MPLDGVDTVAILTTALRGKERGNDMMSWQGREWGGQAQVADWASDEMESERHARGSRLELLVDWIRCD